MRAMKKAFKCNLCGKELRSQTGLNIHISGHHEGLRQIKCNLCAFKTYMKSGLLRHMRTHTGERPFRCAVNDCKSTFKDNEVLKKHMKYKHCSERRFKCVFPSCLFTAKTPETLSQHLRVHIDDRPFACPNTGCEFRAKLRLHIRLHVASVHSATKAFACSTCEFKSARPDALDYHMACHTTTRNFKCSHSTCKKSFKRPLDLKRHIQNRHGQRNFQCDHRGCGRKYGSSSVLHTHKVTCHSKKRLTCPERDCKYATNNPSHLAHHMSVHQRRNERISCSFEGCAYKGKNTEAMEVHLRGHKTLLACPETGCSQYVTSKAKPKVQRTSHKPPCRPYHCPLCFKHFRTLSCLQEHCVSHTKEKQFMCGYCDYGTSQHHQAKNHIYLVHPNVQFPFIAHHQDLRECLRCKVILPSSQFLVHSMAHATPLVTVTRLETKFINF